MEHQLRKVNVKGGGQIDDTPWRGIKTETPAALRQAWDDLRPLLLPLVIGVAIGAFIYGFVPEEGLSFMAGQNVWWLILRSEERRVGERGEFPVGAWWSK